jgi:arylsulfatase
MHLFTQDDFYSTWTPNNMPILYNLEWDPREEHQVDFPHAWVAHPIAAAAGDVLADLGDRASDQTGNP